MNALKTPLLALVSAAAIGLGGCASTPESANELEQLQNRADRLAQQSNAEELAPVALQNAQQAISEAQNLIDEGADEIAIEHSIYLAEKRLDIVDANVEMTQADQIVQNADSLRKDVLLDVRQKQLEQAEARAKRMSMRADDLETSVQDLRTEETERGLVLTLGSVLFETGESTLRSGSQRTVQKVADFLNQYPEQDIVIEGFTDSTGSQQLNERLSTERAQAVKDMLVGFGVASDRVQTKGYGEQFPVASNETSAGRLQNRRVEIVVSKDGQPVSERMSMR